MSLVEIIMRAITEMAELADRSGQPEIGMTYRSIAGEFTIDDILVMLNSVTHQPLERLGDRENGKAFLREVDAILTAAAMEHAQARIDEWRGRVLLRPDDSQKLLIVQRAYTAWLLRAYALELGWHIAQSIVSLGPALAAQRGRQVASDWLKSLPAY